MEKYPVFMNWQMLYCSDGNNLQVNLQTQYSPSQNLSWLLFFSSKKFILHCSKDVPLRIPRAPKRVTAPCKG